MEPAVLSVSLKEYAATASAVNLMRLAALLRLEASKSLPQGTRRLAAAAPDHPEAAPPSSPDRGAQPRRAVVPREVGRELASVYTSISHACGLYVSGMSEELEGSQKARPCFACPLLAHASALGARGAATRPAPGRLRWAGAGAQGRPRSAQPGMHAMPLSPIGDDSLLPAGADYRRAAHIVDDGDFRGLLQWTLDALAARSLDESLDDMPAMDACARALVEYDFPKARASPPALLLTP